MQYERLVSIYTEELPKINEVYRSKGFVKTEKGNFLVNYVAQRATFEKFDEEEAGLVFIGANIIKDQKKIEKMFEL
jgi:hypothetical protein